MLRIWTWANRLRITPKASRDAAARPLADHLSEFKGDLEARKRDGMYIYNVDKRIRKLCKECAWVYVRDITADSFVAWRSKQKKAAKTLNDYLDAIWCPVCSKPKRKHTHK